MQGNGQTGPRANGPTGQPVAWAARFVLVALFLFVWICGGASAEAAFRRVDPVVITGAALQKLPGEDIASLRLYAVRAGRLVPIPFQIDMRTREGEYVFSGTDKGRDASKATALSDRDELVFMARDMGQRVGPRTARTLGDAAGLRKGVEIEAEDPATRQRRWAYVFAFTHPPARSPVDYVSYNKADDLISSPDYFVGFKNPKIRTSLNYAAIRRENGESVDLVDRFKARAEATFLWGSLRIRKTEGNFRSKVLDIRDGPVRVIRKSRYAMRLLWKIPTPGAVAHAFFYRNGIDLPTHLNVPFDVGYVVSEISSRVSLDFNSAMIGARFFNPRNPQGVLIDGIMSPSERAMDLGAFEWLAVEGPQGGILFRVVLEDDLPVTMTLFYRDDAREEDPPEDSPGQYGNVGWRLGNMEALKKGKYRYRTFVYFTNSLGKGQRQQCLDVYDHPLALRASPIDIPPKGWKPRE